MIVDVRPATEADRAWIDRLLDARWGGPIQVANGRSYRPADLQGFVAWSSGERVGYAAFDVAADVAWIGLIDAVEKRRGVGTSLVRRLIDEARSRECVSLRVITTNDNLPAQALYERLGFTLRQLRRGAVDESRRIKPTIPPLAADGTPITDELEYELML